MATASPPLPTELAAATVSHSRHTASRQPPREPVVTCFASSPECAHGESRLLPNGYASCANHFFMCYRCNAQHVLIPTTYHPHNRNPRFFVCQLCHVLEAVVSGERKTEQK